jgi:glycosyltransferase involved in cell wall biosynthesis
MISVCITCLNDNDELEHTIQSIRDTAGDRPEIIVIDDASDRPVTTKHKGIVRRRNPVRRGVAASRDLAVQIAKREHVLLTDSHMRFEPGWYENILPRLHPETAWCGTCLGLSAANMDLKKVSGYYNGANLVLYSPPPKEGESATIFEGKWAPGNKKDGADVPCFMGACYFIPRAAYIKVRGLGMLKQWGSDEPYLSSKLWLAGYEIKYAKDVRIGHMFRKPGNVPYKNMIWCLIYNKLRAFSELFDHETYKFIRSAFPDSPPLHKAIAQIAQDSNQISLASGYYRGIFKHDVRWMCERFGIHHPLDYANLCQPSNTIAIRRAANRFVSPGVRPGQSLGPTPYLVGQGVR